MQRHTCVTSVNSSWETKSWVHQPGELHQHLLMDFFTCHVCSTGKMQNAMQQKRHDTWILSFQTSNIRHISLLSQEFLNDVVSAFCIANARTSESGLTTTKCDAWVKTGDGGPWRMLNYLEGFDAMRQFGKIKRRKATGGARESLLSPMFHGHVTPQNLGHEFLQTTVNLSHLVKRDLVYQQYAASWVCICEVFITIPSAFRDGHPRRSLASLDELQRSDQQPQDACHWRHKRKLEPRVVNCKHFTIFIRTLGGNVWSTTPATWWRSPFHLWSEKCGLWIHYLLLNLRFPVNQAFAGS